MYTPIMKKQALEDDRAFKTRMARQRAIQNRNRLKTALLKDKECYSFLLQLRLS